MFKPLTEAETARLKNFAKQGHGASYIAMKLHKRPAQIEMVLAKLGLEKKIPVQARASNTYRRDAELSNIIPMRRYKAEQSEPDKIKDKEYPVPAPIYHHQRENIRYERGNMVQSVEVDGTTIKQEVPL